MFNLKVLLNSLYKDENVMIYNLDRDDIEYVGNCKEFNCDVDFNVVEITTHLEYLSPKIRREPKLYIYICVEYWEDRNYNSIC